MQDLFADRLFNIAVHQGVARLDFARLERVDAEKKQAVLQPSVRLALPLEAFMNLADQVAKLREEIMKQAIAAGAPVAETPAAN